MQRRLEDAELEFDRLYGPFWHSVIPGDAYSVVMRSAKRYAAFANGDLDRPSFR